jgi:AhpC/TSA family
VALAARLGSGLRARAGRVSPERGEGGPLGFGPDEQRERWAHRRDPDLDEEDRAPVGPPRMPPGTSRYGWFLGVVVVLLIAYISVNALRSSSVGSKGLPVGTAMPPFAAPLATSSLNGDVNVARRVGQGAAGKVPACSVRGPGVLNSCALARRGPVVLAFTVTTGSQCTHELDAIEQVRARHPGVQFAAVAIRGDRSALRGLVRRHGWGFPVAYDRDGVLANLYGVAVCPQITYALPGGRISDTTIGVLEPAALDRRIGALEAAARRQGWRPGR